MRSDYDAIHGKEYKIRLEDKGEFVGISPCYNDYNGIYGKSERKSEMRKRKNIRKWPVLFICILFLIDGLKVMAADNEVEQAINAISSLSARTLSGSVEDRINTLKATYPAGSYFSANGQACGSSSICSNCKLSSVPSRGGLSTGQEVANAVRDGWQCCAFARYAYYNIFGISPYDGSNAVYTSFDNAQIGDYVECYKSGSSTPAHYAIYLGRSGSTVYFYESNWGVNNRVYYNQTHAISGFSSYKIYHAYNYPAAQKPPTVTSVSTSKSVYKIDETVTVTVKADNATWQYAGVEKRRVMVAGNECTEKMQILLIIFQQRVWG